MIPHGGIHAAVAFAVCTGLPGTHFTRQMLHGAQAASDERHRMSDVFHAPDDEPEEAEIALKTADVEVQEAGAAALRIPHARVLVAPPERPEQVS